MAILLLPSVLLTVIFCMVATSSRRMHRRGQDEEFAHSAALARRHLSTAERRREDRCNVPRLCTAAVLGQEETRTPCRVLNVSRSGIRIAVCREFAMDAQVIVEWKREFFVGSVCDGSVQGEDRVFGLRLVSTNCRKGGFEA